MERGGKKEGREEEKEVSGKEKEESERERTDHYQFATEVKEELRDL